MCSAPHSVGEPAGDSAGGVAGATERRAQCFEFRAAQAHCVLHSEVATGAARDGEDFVDLRFPQRARLFRVNVLSRFQAKDRVTRLLRAVRRTERNKVNVRVGQHRLQSGVVGYVAANRFG